MLQPVAPAPGVCKHTTCRYQYRVEVLDGSRDFLQFDLRMDSQGGNYENHIHLPDIRRGTVSARPRVGASMDAASGVEVTGYGASKRSGANGNRAVYILSQSGGAATWVVRLVRFRPLAAE